MVCVACFVLIPVAGFARIGVWEEVASLDVARGGLGAAVIDGRVYAIGGLGERFPIKGAVEAYDPERDAWTSRALLY
jgi:kelch-like protein 17 (actinfilin)/kelch-like protein 20